MLKDEESEDRESDGSCQRLLEEEKSRGELWNVVEMRLVGLYESIDKRAMDWRKKMLYCYEILFWLLGFKWRKMD